MEGESEELWELIKQNQRQGESDPETIERMIRNNDSTVKRLNEAAKEEMAHGTSVEQLGPIGKQIADADKLSFMLSGELDKIRKNKSEK